MDPALKGRVQTVLGIVEPSALGRTLTHEHLYFLGVPNLFIPKGPNVPALIKNKPVAMEDLGWIRQNPYSHEDNMIFCDEEAQNAVLDEMKKYKKNGGGCIVENSTCGQNNEDYKILQKISEGSGVHIVAGTGYYVAPGQIASTLELSVEDLMASMKRDLLEGVPGTDGIKCGVIGEVGCSWPIHPFEKKSLAASGQLQEELGCPVIIHPGRDEVAPFEALRIFQEAGGIVGKTVMSHLDRVFFENAKLTEFAAMGSYCEFDLFGIETSHYQLNPDLDMPNDAQRIARLRHLVEEGFSKKIVVSHDLHTKHRLEKFGGHGYSHILVNVVPKMLSRGFSREAVDDILIHNPQTWLAYR